MKMRQVERNGVPKNEDGKGSVWVASGRECEGSSAYVGYGEKKTAVERGCCGGKGGINPTYANAAGADKKTRTSGLPEESSGCMRTS